MSEKVVNMDLSKYAPMGWVPGASESTGPDPFSVSGVQDRKAVVQRLQASKARFAQSEYKQGFDIGARLTMPAGAFRNTGDSTAGSMSGCSHLSTRSNARKSRRAVSSGPAYLTMGMTRGCSARPLMSSRDFATPPARSAN
jgi:hypothetical protein